MSDVTTHRNFADRWNPQKHRQEQWQTCSIECWKYSSTAAWLIHEMNVQLNGLHWNCKKCTSRRNYLIRAACNNYCLWWQIYDTEKVPSVFYANLKQPKQRTRHIADRTFDSTLYKKECEHDSKSDHLRHCQVKIFFRTSYEKFVIQRTRKNFTSFQSRKIYFLKKKKCQRLVFHSTPLSDELDKSTCMDLKLNRRLVHLRPSLCTE